MNRFILGVLAWTLILPLASASANWPTWRGPHADGTADAANPPIRWSETENIRWKAPLAAWSASSPVVWGDKVFVIAPESSGKPIDKEVLPKGSPERGPYALGEDLGGAKIFLICLARADGHELWRSQIGEDNKVLMRRQNSCSPSPVTDGASVYALTGLGEIVAIDFDGRELWRRNLVTDFGKIGSFWGQSASPLLLDDRLIVSVIHGKMTKEPSYLLALEKKTGKDLWRVLRPSDAEGEAKDAYTTPALIKGSEKSEVVINGADCVTGHDPATGKELWRAVGLNPKKDPMGRIFASCIAAGGLILAPSAGNPMMALRGGGEGDVSSTHLAWQTRWGPELASPVSDGKYVYCIGANGRAICLETATGAEVYKERAGTGMYVSSPVLAGGRIYALNDAGETSVIQAGAEFKVLAKNDLEGSFVMASPAVSGDQLFIRTSRFLYCIEETRRPG